MEIIIKTNKVHISFFFSETNTIPVNKLIKNNIGDSIFSNNADGMIKEPNKIAI
ncbi:hypothetical protein GCM10023311_17020 [Flaviramulus aquimarinus]|uniref:Uncharacterized protein n=1 Tax=Flaviramulus aquimarinus TaxID=1170456 RepID=A0ABP9F2X2_9FLAO